MNNFRAYAVIAYARVPPDPHIGSTIQVRDLDFDILNTNVSGLNY